MTKVRLPNLNRISSKDHDRTSQMVCAAALEYVRTGFAVLPLWGIQDSKCACNRSRCPSPGKHPISELVPRGEKDASSDELTVRRWFRKYPHANLGLVVGNGVVVLDIDGPEGEHALASITLRPPTAEVRTGRGRHLYFKGAGHTRIGAKPSLDFKASGYVVAPPSRHVTGKLYAWTKPLSQIRDLPPELASLGGDAKTRTLGGSFLEGRRNDGLMRIAGSLRRQGLAKREIISVLTAVNMDLCSPQLPIGEVQNIAKSAAQYDSANEDQRFADMADVKTEFVDFLWGTRIPLGFLTLLDGRPGTGKSMLLAKIAAMLTRGECLPFDTAAREGGVLFMSVEDPPSQVMRPRLERFGANLERVRYADRHFVLDNEGIDYLAAEVAAQRPLLVVLDPLFAYLGDKVDSHRSNEVMPFMYRLDRIAREFRCAIVGVRHLTKAVHDDVLNAGIGSIGIIGAVRSALLLAIYPEQEGVLAVAHYKHNLSAEAPAVLFKRVGGSSTRPPRIEFIKTEVIDAQTLVHSPGQDRGRPSDERDEASGFLRNLLANGPVASRIVFSKAESYSFSDKTMRRALEKIGGRVLGKGPAAKWSSR